MDRTEGIPLLDNDEPTDQPVRQKSGSGRSRIITPNRLHFDHPRSAFVAYSWLHVFAQREVLLGQESPDTPPGASPLSAAR